MDSLFGGSGVKVTLWKADLVRRKPRGIRERGWKKTEGCGEVKDG